MIRRYHRAGAVGSRWVPWSSKPVARRSARRGGFDSHAFPPWRFAMSSGGPPLAPRASNGCSPWPRLASAARRPDARRRSRRPRARSIADGASRLRRAAPSRGARGPGRRAGRSRLTRLRGSARRAGCHAGPQRDRRHPAHEPRPGALAGRRRSRRRRAAAGGYSLLELDRDERPARAAASAPPRSTSSR